ncbi:hypothetical protein SAMN05428960_1824 [Mitsuaria sp. PDC51]|uniref:hypothetical protein n=1 Tax=Mitsuaria sp. PDC51 TaxID=1881035 RepID=UPI0008EF7AB2|nr:hypothetical protein [Mitsuaria sp. PDC51]SFR79643.1 hypothetical protein SAMN05428960_1824 [Mitsuaria sp. PDC51]
MPAFDPWNDAELLGRHLAREDAELLVVIGAEGWCEKCKRLRPAFETLCQAGMPSQVAWMWLDLEDHHEFLGEFIPPDLPLLLRWRKGFCVQAAVVEDIALDAAPNERVKLRPMHIEGTGVSDPNQGEAVELPALWGEFVAETWAEGSPSR